MNWWGLFLPRFAVNELIILVRSKTPAADVPIRSVTLASDGLCLVAGNNRVGCLWRFACHRPNTGWQGQCYVWRINDEHTGLPRFQAVTRFQAHTKYLTRCLLSPDARFTWFGSQKIHYLLELDILLPVLRIQPSKSGRCTETMNLD